MAGTTATLRSSTSVPDRNKRRSVVNKKRKSAVGNKISKLRGEGKSQAQSVAIALSMQRRGDL